MTWPTPTHDSLVAKLCRLGSPGYSHCLRCGMPWNTVEHHSTWYAKSSACFPLCESCWQLLGSPEARVEYYKTLIDYWARDLPVSEQTARDIQKAVANGG